MTMLTPSQVAQLHPHLGTARTIQRWAREERVTHHRTPGGHIRFAPQHVDALLECIPKREYRPEVNAPNPDYRPAPDVAPRLVLVQGKPKRGRRRTA